MPNDEKANIFSKEGLIAVIILFTIYASYQYFQMRGDVQETAEQLLTDNGYSGYTSDGINLPISAVLNGNATAKIFLKDNSGNTEITQVQITSKGIPLLSVFTGGEYWVEISGPELMKLTQ